MKTAQTTARTPLNGELVTRELFGHAGGFVLLRALVGNFSVVTKRIDDKGVFSKEDAELIARAVNSHADLIAALENAAAQFDFTVAALAKGQTVSINSLQNCAAACNVAIAKAKLGLT